MKSVRSGTGGESVFGHLLIVVVGDEACFGFFDLFQKQTRKTVRKD